MNYQDANQDTPQLFQKHRAEDEVSIASYSDKGNIQQKIGIMTKTLAEVTVMTTSKSMDCLKRLQDQRENNFKNVNDKQKQILQGINQLQKKLLAFDRQRIIKYARQKTAEEDVYRVLNQGENQFRRIGEQNHERYSQLSDKMSNIKIQMVQKEAQVRQKAAKFQRDTQHRVNIIEKGMGYNKSGIQLFRQKMKKQFKLLRTAIDQDTKFIEKQQTKTQSQIMALHKIWQKKIEEQRNKQKQGFQHNYKALQQIFKLMSQQSIDEQ